MCHPRSRYELHECTSSSSSKVCKNVRGIGFVHSTTRAAVEYNQNKVVVLYL